MCLLSTDAAGTAFVRISDMLGKVLYSQTFSGEQQFPIDISQYSPAVYIITVTTARNTYYRKLILEH
ncbi:MAG: T9SS type A sorting domain-containing protein [Bacteroidia bacterium]|nr:T9SS type A sorting domain-containing protein [Bacteroidia bacterium]